MSAPGLHTPAEAAELLKVPESWLRKKAAARVIPCTFIGKHLRFTDDDVEAIIRSGARHPLGAPSRDHGRPRRRTEVR